MGQEMAGKSQCELWAQERQAAITKRRGDLGKEWALICTLELLRPVTALHLQPPWSPPRSLSSSLITRFLLWGRADGQFCFIESSCILLHRLSTRTVLTCTIHISALFTWPGKHSTWCYTHLWCKHPSKNLNLDIQRNMLTHKLCQPTVVSICRAL